MGSINSKILKSELLILFTITVLALLAFSWESSLPDNYLQISSDSAKVNFLTYYISSFVAFVGYYIGPWVFFPFLIFTPLYALKFSKRDLNFDPLNIVSLLLATLFASYALFPDLVGTGLSYFLSTNFTNLIAGGLSFLFFVAFLAGSFRDSFLDNIKGFFAFFMGIFSINYAEKIEFVLLKVKAFFSKIQMGIGSLLKGDFKKSKFKNLPESGSLLPISKNRELPMDNSPALKRTEEIPVNNPNAIQMEMEEVKKNSDKPSTNANNTKTKSNPNVSYSQLVSTISSGDRQHKNQHPDNKYFQEIVHAIEAKLTDFKIDGQIINILKGPVVDTFELELGTGVKVSKVTTAENDLSMALKGAPIRIVYPMIGRTTVGIEVPRNPREIIYLDELLSSKEFAGTSSLLPIAMGKDAFGEPFVVDLAKMPHMLVAGATGAGKSVFINTLIVSLLVKKSPEDMKLILIDPKQLELALYANLPHLVMPVITDPKRASISMLWACQEMERRYSILKEFGVRNIEGFNDKLDRATPDMLAKIHQHYDDENFKLPYLVIIIDEFADLILTKAGKEIENNVCRLAAKARAAGIHLVLATQRPSVDVITGLIKSNFPTRVSFRVTASQDSRTILNTVGAEKLLGMGDMLYKHGTKSCRAHSSYIEEEEIEKFMNELTNIPQEFHEGAINFLENEGEEEGGGVDPYSFGSHLTPDRDIANGKDELYSEAVRIVVEHRTASASMLQRRLRVGYNRAANLIEEMEKNGVVGPAEGSKRRKVLYGSETL